MNGISFGISFQAVPILKKIGLLAAALAVGLAVSCAKQKEYLIPEKKTASEQYKFALAYYQKQMSIPTLKKDQIYPPVYAAYEKVLERFPDDQQFTPLAVINMGDMYASQGQYKEALKKFDYARKKYAGLDRIQAYTMLRRGQCLQELKRPEEARELYKRVADMYQGHPDKDIQGFVRQAQTLYNQVLVK